MLTDSNVCLNSTWQTWENIHSSYNKLAFASLRNKSDQVNIVSKCPSIRRRHLFSVCGGLQWQLLAPQRPFHHRRHLITLAVVAKGWIIVRYWVMLLFHNLINFRWSIIRYTNTLLCKIYGTVNSKVQQIVYVCILCLVCVYIVN